MGYTHYWTQTRNFTADEWADVTRDVGEIVKDVMHVQGIPLADGMGDGGTSPEFSHDRIAFNGLGDDAHESFGIDRLIPALTADDKQWGKRRGSDFCKTARKPYDIAVTATLCYLATICETHHVTSDGDGTDWLDGLAEARQALPRYANRIDIPRQILEDDRWCLPHLYLTSATYVFRFCIDSHAYVIRQKDGKSYRFASHREAAEWLERNGGRNLWDATGSFDARRTAGLARRQSAKLRDLVELADLFADDGRNIPPPALVRPGQMPKPATTSYCFTDLLNATGNPVTA